MASMVEQILREKLARGELVIDPHTDAVVPASAGLSAVTPQASEVPQAPKLTNGSGDSVVVKPEAYEDPAYSPERRFKPSFNEAFSWARQEEQRLGRKPGTSTFEYDGKAFTTQTAEDVAAQPPEAQGLPQVPFGSGSPDAGSFQEGLGPDSSFLKGPTFESMSSPGLADTSPRRTPLPQASPMLPKADKRWETTDADPRNFAEAWEDAISTAQSGGKPQPEFKQITEAEQDRLWARFAEATPAGLRAVMSSTGNLAAGLGGDSPWSNSVRKRAAQLQPSLLKMDLEQAWNSDKFGDWLALSAAEGAPMAVASVIAALSGTGAVATFVSLMGGSAAGNKYAKNIQAGMPEDEAGANALYTGIGEAGSEYAGIKFLKYAQKYWQGLPLAARQKTLGKLAGWLGLGGAVVLEEGGEGAASQAFENTVDYLTATATPENAITQTPQKTPWADAYMKDIREGLGTAFVKEALGGAVAAPVYAIAAAAPTPKELAEDAKARAALQDKQINARIDYAAKLAFDQSLEAARAADPALEQNKTRLDAAVSQAQKAAEEAARQTLRTELTQATTPADKPGAFRTFLDAIDNFRRTGAAAQDDLTRLYDERGIGPEQLSQLQPLVSQWEAAHQAGDDAAKAQLVKAAQQILQPPVLPHGAGRPDPSAVDLGEALSQLPPAATPAPLGLDDPNTAVAPSPLGDAVREAAELPVQNPMDPLGQAISGAVAQDSPDPMAPPINVSETPVTPQAPDSQPQQPAPTQGAQLTPAPETPQPEAVTSIGTQIAAMFDPSSGRDAVLVAKGQSAPAVEDLPEGTLRYEFSDGDVLLTTSKKKLLQAVSADKAGNGAAVKARLSLGAQPNEASQGTQPADTQPADPTLSEAERTQRMDPFVSAPPEAPVEETAPGANGGGPVFLNREGDTTTINNTTVQASKPRTPEEARVRHEDSLVGQQPTAEQAAAVEQVLRGDPASQQTQAEVSQYPELRGVQVLGLGDINWAGDTRRQTQVTLPGGQTQTRYNMDRRQAATIGLVMQALYGQEVVFYQSDDVNSPDGFHLPGDTRRVFVKANGTTVAPEHIPGHEFFHSVEAAGTDGVMDAYASAFWGVGPTGMRRFAQDAGYASQDLDETLDRAQSEVSADLSGQLHAPLFARTRTWDTVFDGLREKHGTAKAKQLIKNFYRATGNMKDEVVRRVRGLDTGYDTPNRFLDETGLNTAFEAIAQAVRNFTPGPAGELMAGQARKAMGVQTSESRPVLSSEYAVQPNTSSDVPVDRARVTTLRRAAAGLEAPERGITFRITDDGRAVVTGPARGPIPTRFKRFAEQHGLTYEARRGPVGGAPAMPVQYRESGARYASEMGTPGVDRTDRTRFSTKRSALGDALRVAKGKAWQKGRDFKEAIQQFAPRIDVDNMTPDQRAALVDEAIKDVLFALEQNPNAVGWYDLKTRQALAIMALVHPELATDENARFAFTWALAVTSNGMKVDKNFKLAEDAYRRYKQTGQMPTDIQAGQAQAAINDSLQLFNELRDKWGINDLRDFMLTNFTVGEIGALSKDLKPGGEHVDVTVKGAAILGPKIGNGFFSNLYGNFDSLTMDRWLVRTWGRWTGTLLKPDPENTANASSRLQRAATSVPESARAALEEVIGHKLLTNDIAALADAVHEASTDPKLRKVMNKLPGGEELRKAGNSLWKYLDGQKEAPSGPGERKIIRSVFRDVLAQVQQQPEYADLTMADLQAALWYAEKRLYETAKNKEILDEDEDVAGYTDDEAPDYANAAAMVARENGVTQRRINNVLNREEQNGRPTSARPAEAGSPEAGAGPAEQGTGAGFTRQEKRAFIRTQAVHSVRSAAGRGGSEPGTYVRESGKNSGKPRLLKKLGVRYVAKWEPAGQTATVFRANGIAPATFLELESTQANGERFNALISASRQALGDFGAAVYVYAPEEYAGMRMLVTEDGNAGVAVKPDGDIVSVFGTGYGDAIVQAAVSAGGVKLDGFDTILGNLYGRHGFKVASRLKWDDGQAPDDWNKTAFSEFNGGEPDVLFMVYDPAYFGKYTRKDGKQITDYDKAVRAQRKAVRQVQQAGTGSNSRVQASTARFFSPLAKAVGTAKSEAQPARQWALWLQANKAKLGLKDDEIQWSGILDYLNLRGKEKVSKAEVLDYLNGNGVKVLDVVKGRAGIARVSQADIDAAEADGNWDEVDRLTRIYEDQELGNNANGTGNDTKFSGWWDKSFKGGIEGTYREILVTLPADLQFTTRYQIWNDDENALVTTVKDETKAKAFIEGKQGLSIRPVKSEVTKDVFRSSHWTDTPNVLVHLRTDEVMGADGQRYLRVGEIQSDWGQDGKKEGFDYGELPVGYSLVEKPWPAEFGGGDGKTVWTYAYEDPVWGWKEAMSTEATKEGARKNAWMHSNLGMPGTPAAPFVTDTKAWVALGVKRAILHAIDSGVDGIVFGTGQQNADIYGLSKSIKDIVYLDASTGGPNQAKLDAPEDGGLLIARDSNLKIVIEEYFEASELPNIIGKDVAEKLLSAKPDNYTRGGIGRRRRKLSGLDLKVGGEGMRAFYDQIVPSVANDVLKKLGGGKVAPVAIDVTTFGKRGRPADWNPQYGAQSQQPGFTIPDAMREKVQAEGVPLFSKGRINVDGIERPTTNSNGQQLHPTEEGIKNFWRWFGDSKVVDAEGRPLVVYHGTASDITEFDPSKTEVVEGVFLTPDNKSASAYSNDKMGQPRDGANVMPIYVSMQNPRVIDVSKGDYYNLTNLSTAMSDGANDGVIVRGEDGEIAVIVAKGPTQIKSATGNDGTFSPTNPDIRYAMGRQRKTPEELRQSFAEMVGQGDIRAETFVDDELSKLEDWFNAAKRGVVPNSDTEAAGRALAEKLGWSLEDVTAMVSAGNLAVGGDKTLPAGDVLAAAGATAQLAVAKLLDNPKSPTFAADLANVLNLMIATRANLSELGRALQYAGWLQRRANVSPEERKRLADEAVRRAQDFAKQAAGLSGNLNEQERTLVNQYNEKLRNLADATMSHEESVEAMQGLAGQVADAHQRLKDARKARDEAKSRLTAAQRDLRQAEAKTDAVQKATATDQELARAEAEVARAKAALDQARAMRQARKEAIAEAERRVASAEAQAKRIRDKAPTPKEILDAQAAARRAEADAAKAYAEKQAAYRELQAARAKLKAAVDRAARAALATQKAKQDLARVPKPGFVGKGGVSMDEIITYLGGQKGLDRMQRALALYGKNADVDHVARFLQGIANNLHKTKKERALRKGAWGRVHNLMAMWLEQFRAFILTGLMTHGINILSNSVFGTVEQLLTRPLAEALPGGRGAIKHYRNLGAAFIRSVADVYPALRFGMTEEFPAAHFEAFIRMRPELQDEAMQLGSNKWMDNHGGALPGLWGKAVRTIGFSPLGAADLVFKLVPYRLSVRMQEASGKPVDYSEAVAAAEYQTFQTQLSEGMNGLSRFVNSIPLLGFIVPFLKTLVNLVNRTLDYTPVLSQLRNVDNFSGAPDKRNLALAQGVIGAVLAAVAIALHGEGDDDPDSKLSGTGPTRPEKRALWLASNEPLALAVGDWLVPMWRVEPFASAMGLSIAVSDAVREYGRDADLTAAAKTVASAFTQVVVGKNFMKGLEDALSAALSIDTMGYRYFTETLPQSMVYGATIPNLVNQFGDMTDPWKREARTWEEQLLKRLPWRRQELEPKLDYAGRPIAEPREGALLPIQRVPSKTDEVAQVLLAMNQGIVAQPKAFRDMLTEVKDQLIEMGIPPEEARKAIHNLRKESLQDRYQRIEETMVAAVENGITREDPEGMAALESLLQGAKSLNTRDKAAELKDELNAMRQRRGLPERE